MAIIKEWSWSFRVLSSIAHTEKVTLIYCFTHTQASGVISVLIKSGIYLKTETDQLCLVILYMFIIKYIISFPSDFLPNIALVNSQPLVKPPLSSNSHQSRRANTTRHLFEDMWRQPTTSVQTAAHIASWCGITHSEESAICPLLHAWAQRHTQGVAVIERKERMHHHHFHTEIMANFDLLQHSNSRSRSNRQGSRWRLSLTNTIHQWWREND